MKIKAEIDGSTKEFGNITNFNGSVLDGEAKTIVAEQVLSSFHLNDVLSLLELLITKCHKGGIVSILEYDMYRLSKAIVENPENMDDVNNHFEAYSKYCCFLTLPYLELLVNRLKLKDIRIIGREITSSGKFILTLRRDTKYV
jgi:hypothetical protein